MNKTPHRKLKGNTFSLRAMLYDNTLIPDWIMERPELSPTEKLLYARLLRYLGDNQFAWPAVNTLATKISISKRNVQYALRNLEKLGLVAVEYQPNNSSHYHLPQTNASTAGKWMREYVKRKGN
jgi:DNA-binding MarR family transcriptional regulator